MAMPSNFRYNIPELAKNYKVYALDLLGFGWSEKALIDYDALIWRDQVVDFMKEIVKEPAVLVGNRQVFISFCLSSACYMLKDNFTICARFMFTSKVIIL